MFIYIQGDLYFTSNILILSSPTSFGVSLDLVTTILCGGWLQRTVDEDMSSNPLTVR